MKIPHLLATFLIAWLPAGIAYAAIVDIRVSGTLFETSLGDDGLPSRDDPYGLEGAQFTQVLQYDTAVEGLGGGSVLSLFFEELAAEVRFFNRPNGAADITAIYECCFYQLDFRNRFAPSTENDIIRFNGAIFTSEFSFDNAHGFAFDLGRQDYFPGTGLPDLPVLSNSDVAEFQSSGEFGTTTPFGPNYGVRNVTYNINVVPIPAAVWLFGSALAGLCFTRRRRA